MNHRKIITAIIILTKSIWHRTTIPSRKIAFINTHNGVHFVYGQPTNWNFWKLLQKQWKWWITKQRFWDEKRTFLTLCFPDYPVISVKTLEIRGPQNFFFFLNVSSIFLLYHVYSTNIFSSYFRFFIRFFSFPTIIPLIKSWKGKEYKYTRHTWLFEEPFVSHTVFDLKKSGIVFFLFGQIILAYTSFYQVKLLMYIALKKKSKRFSNSRRNKEKKKKSK